MVRKQTHFIHSLARGLSILQAFSARRSKLTLTQLSEITEMNKTAVQRSTDTLLELGFLGRNRHKEFFLGAKVMSLGFAYLQGSELIKLAAGLLKDLSFRMGGTVNMAVLDDTRVVFLYRNEVRELLRYDLGPGSKLPSHCTATGKVLLASLDDEELRPRIERMGFERMTSRTIVSVDALLEDLYKTRSKGIAICDRELLPNQYSIGVPILNNEKKVIAAVNLSRVFEESEIPFHIQDKDVRAVVDQGRRVSELMGYEGAYPIIKAGSWEDTLI